MKYLKKKLVLFGNLEEHLVFGATLRSRPETAILSRPACKLGLRWHLGT